MNPLGGTHICFWQIIFLVVTKILHTPIREGVEMMVDSKCCIKELVIITVVM